MTDIEMVMERIRDIQIEIDEKCEQIVQIKDRVMKITQTLNDMPKIKGFAVSKTENAVITMLIRVNQFELEINQFNLVRELVERDIRHLVKNRRQQSVLILRYIYNLSWNKITRALHVSSSQLHRDHQKAMKEIEKVGTLWE